jgi:hypothetical protein
MQIFVNLKPRSMPVHSSAQAKKKKLKSSQQLSWCGGVFTIEEQIEEPVDVYGNEGDREIL